ncbi:hypothetical protein N7468_002385 [Penicillium chermesinum]|uniref:ASST-domain-containing protein n=1 Tax=Penicillium chermesinum TaxID=63820 RepID=A0A9W9TXX9_9EURO|nr:uncharacterized protein N7468_002385 [Penicillium chermesinum]KAJ5247402.1 hypothetical protein N7468_002385 [Penicillium chermesinum]
MPIALCAQYSQVGGMASSDMHEFMPINGGKTALMTVYQQRQFDMSPWNIKTGVGWVMESVFQEVDIETSKVLFEWRSLDHVDPSNSYTLPSATDTSGTGLHVSEPWDYFHINSIDKNADGDYLISSRHTSAIYKVSGKNGSVIWRLHGSNPTFRNINFSFSQQHDARWLYENKTHSVVSLYNNGYNGFNQTHPYSSGMVILIDHIEKTALQVREYLPKIPGLVSSSQGNLQRLPNNNVFMGWGNNVFVSEHSEEGELVLWASFAEAPVMNYRAMKFEWEGNPTDSPALWTYSRTSEPFSPTTFYASWNGATRIKSWRFYGAHDKDGSWTLLDDIDKAGFETEYHNATFFPWTRAEAVNKDGVILGKSEVKYTFVPSPDLSLFCQDETCADAPAYGLPDEGDAPITIPPVGVSTVPWVDLENGGTYPSGFPHVDAENEAAEHDRQGKKQVLSWSAAVLFFGILGPLYFIYRRYQRHQRQDLCNDDAESAESLTGRSNQNKTPANPNVLPWWNWRRWAGEKNTSGPYFALSDHNYPPTYEQRRARMDRRD